MQYFSYAGVNTHRYLTDTGCRLLFVMYKAVYEQPPIPTLQKEKYLFFNTNSTLLSLNVAIEVCRKKRLGYTFVYLFYKVQYEIKIISYYIVPIIIYFPLWKL